MEEKAVDGEATKSGLRRQPANAPPNCRNSRRSILLPRRIECSPCSIHLAEFFCAPPGLSVLAQIDSPLDLISATCTDKEIAQPVALVFLRAPNANHVAFDLAD